MRNRIKLFVICLVIFALTASHAQELWVAKDGSIRNVDTRAMVAADSGLYLATSNEIYRAKDAKDRWESIFALGSGSNEVTSLAARGKTIFVGTKRGLFRSDDYGKNWKSVFRTIIPEKNNVISIEISRYNPKNILLATAKGVFTSEDSGGRWEDVSGSLKNQAVGCIALNKESAYAGSEGGLYVRRGEGAEWERIYVHSAAEKAYEEGIPDSTEAEEVEQGGISCIAMKDSNLYIGIGRKILYSEDEGKTWKSFPADGLAGYVNYIAPSQKGAGIFSATTRGVFEFDAQKARWFELYKGSGKNLNAKRLMFDGESEKGLWALTDNGLYRLEGGRYLADQYIDVERNIKTLKMLFDGEPAYAQLQKAAMAFAEVNPEKIARWRTEARMRALLPKISVGLDKNRSSNYEIYTSATKDYIVGGPDDVSNGLDVSVSWELADLIWSDDQTSIDVRSRLTTQLRNDILDDLRRAYFERKRLQFELMQSPPGDIKVKFDKELRIRELTQAIDDLTGNYLSEHIQSQRAEQGKADLEEVGREGVKRGLEGVREEGIKGVKRGWGKRRLKGAIREDKGASPSLTPL